MALDHERYMRLALERACSEPSLRPFASAIVAANGDVLVNEIHRVDLSPTFHGEIVAINRLAETHRDIDWPSLTLYSTAEPCSMCQSAICWANIGTVVFGTPIPYLRELWGEEAMLRAEQVMKEYPRYRGTLIGPVLEAECNEVFRRAAQAPSYRDW
jgi:tRNA(adenine34) deaminase